MQFNLHPVTTHTLTMAMIQVHVVESERKQLVVTLEKLPLDARTILMNECPRKTADDCFKSICNATGLHYVYDTVVSKVSETVDYKSPTSIVDPALTRRKRNRRHDSLVQTAVKKLCF